MLTATNTQLYRTIDCTICGTDAAVHIPLVTSTVRHRGRFFGDPLRVVACPECGVIFLNPQAKPDEYAGFYEQEYYQLNWPSDPEKIQNNVDLLKQETLDFLGHFFKNKSLQAILDQSRPTIIDVGAGYGAGLEFLLQKGITSPEYLAAIEPSREAAEYLKVTLGVDARAELLESNSFSDGQFDMAISLALIEHIQNPLEGLKAFHRLLRSDGLLLLATPCLDEAILQQRGNSWFKIVHTFYFTPASLTNALHRSGFDCVACELHPSSKAQYQTLVVLARKRTTTTLPNVESIQVQQEIKTFQTILDQLKQLETVSKPNRMVETVQSWLNKLKR